ncbi:ProQ/FinO family protein [Malikia spinosa]|uniref:Prop effector n=1 Tax=Malikia spinosa TaxID=86180 RepID=A0A7C9J5W2_9BURK|nr:ProQ/FinO family protein [Malikia spinosa]MYZ51871.1 prop effector [Malikia spinosa]
MNDTQAKPPRSTPSSSQPRRRQGQAAGRQGQPRAQAPANPVLQQLADWYPQLFGEQPRPLKRGIYADLLAAQPEGLDAEGLKAALALHTRSTRYLSSVAAGQARHDLAGQAVEDMAPEHVLHALLEVHRRRQARSQEDLRPKLRQRIAQAFETSGLSREDYAVLLPSRDPAVQAQFDQALDEAAARAAKDAALHRAYSASGLEPTAFADSYGLPLGEVQRMLERVKRRSQQA